MKQNEKILVYAVTGFLVVILLVAIIFGKDSAPQRDQQASSDPAAVRSLEEILELQGSRPAGGEPAEEPAGAPAGDPVGDPAGEPTADPTGEPGAGRQPGAAGTDLGQPGVGQRGVGAHLLDPLAGEDGQSPLAANVQLLPPTPAALVTEKLGLSRREHDFRIVRAQAGDTLSALVQKWCGTTEGYLDMARGLNEELSVLKVGQPVVLPWVDDEEILAAWQARRAGVGQAAPAAAEAAASRSAAASVPFGPPAASPAAGSPAVGSPAVASRKHKVQPGQSLWKIAEDEVGRRGAPAYLEQVRKLNPGLDVDRLRVGQTILLPVGR